MTAARSFLLHDQRNTAWLRLPDWRVDGHAPASAASASSVGNRSRQSPISASRLAARTVPERGRLGKMCWSGCPANSSGDRRSRRRSGSFSASSMATSPRVIWPRASPSAPAQPGRRRGQAAVQDLGADAAGIPGRPQPRRRSRRRVPRRLLAQSGTDAGTPADAAGGLGEQADRAGEGQLQVGAQLPHDLHSGLDQVLAGTALRARSALVGPVSGRRPLPPVTVGAGRVGQHKRVEPVVLFSRRPVPGPPALRPASAPRTPRGRQPGNSLRTGLLPRSIANPVTARSMQTGEELHH